DQHDLEPEHPVTGEAVADDLDAAGVGRDVAADLARALGREVDRPGEAVRRAVGVDGGGDRAGLDAHGGADGVDGIEAAHALERDHQLAGGRDGAAGEACPAAGRNDRHARGGRGAEQRGDVGGRARPGDGAGGGRVDAGPVAAVRVEVGRLDRDVADAGEVG